MKMKIPMLLFLQKIMTLRDFDVFVMLMREQARIIQNKPMQNVSQEDFQDEWYIKRVTRCRYIIYVIIIRVIIIYN